MKKIKTEQGFIYKSHLSSDELHLVPILIAFGVFFIYVAPIFGIIITIFFIFILVYYIHSITIYDDRFIVKHWLLNITRTYKYEDVKRIKKKSLNERFGGARTVIALYMKNSKLIYKINVSNDMYGVTDFLKKRIEGNSVSD